MHCALKSILRDSYVQKNICWCKKLQEVDGKQRMLTQVKCDFLQGCLIAECLNGGSCLFDKEKEAFACSCNLQWSGEKCELGKFLVFLSLIINIR